MSGILAVLYSSIFALPVPFAAVHLLFINLLTDSLPAVAIGMEKSKKDVLKDKPRDATESILTKDFVINVCIQGLLIGIFTMISYHIGLAKGSHGLAMTMAFSTLCLARLFHGFNCRGRKSIFSLGVFNNKFSWIAFISGVILVNAVLLIPALQGLFEITPLSTNELLQIHLFAFIPTLIIQIFKVLRDLIESKNEKTKENFNHDSKSKAA
jgi:Ca2+-transporting ATPase